MNRADAEKRNETLEVELQGVDKDIMRIKNELEELQIRRARIVLQKRDLEPVLGVKDQDNFATGV